MVRKESPPCVWIVDDDEEDVLLIRAAFETAAPHVLLRTLFDGEDLLPQLEATPAQPGLILLDLNMRRMGGMEALRWIRASEGYNHLPVVMMTTSSSPADRSRSATLGANDYHTKPESFHDLIQLVARLTHQWLA
ncbi:response regulator [Tellurirhabdus rosea]|uniref:response regulator n=1 Tax=Tellurirhabdus rosea TaxID=2674997 RepID=UPI0022552740|nr:response regulator [Tellurirhabdus rosea]